MPKKDAVPPPPGHTPPHRRSHLRRLSLVVLVVALGFTGSASAGWRRDSQPPTAPTNVRVAGATASSVTVAWNASTDNVGVAGYYVYNGGTRFRVSASTLNYTFTGLTCGTTVNVSVVAYDRAGNRSAPGTATVATAACPDAQPPTPPTNFSLTWRTANGMAVSWSPSFDNVGVTGYDVYQGSTLMTTTYLTSATLSGLACGTTYSLAVDAFDAAGNHSTRSTMSVATSACADTTAPSAPTGLAASSVTQTGLTLSWNASNDNVGVAGYGVYQGTTLLASPSTTSYALTGLGCGATYPLAVDAFDAAGNHSAKTPLNVSTAACSSPSGSPSTEPAPIAGLGYHQVFRDDFNTLDRSVWDDHIWYDDAPSPSWTGYQTVENGVLNLRTSRNYTYSGGNWPINTLTTFSSGLTFQQGYFEARMKWTKGDGAWPGFWLFSYRHATNPSWPSLNPYCKNNGLPLAQCYSGELDAYEGQGSEPQSFYGTIHRNSSGDYGVADQQNSNNWQPAGVDLTSDFHTYGMLWTATQITWYLDGKPLMSAPVYDSTNQPMFLLLQMWIGGWTMDPDSTTPTTLDTQVDYVQVWQK